MSFQATFKEAFTFKRIIGGLMNFVDKANLEITKNGITLTALDVSKMSFVHLSMKKNLFQNFVCKKNLMIGIKLQVMKKFLNCASDNDRMELSIVEEEDDFMKIVYLKTNQMCEISEFKMRLIDWNFNLSVPPIKYSFLLILPSCNLRRICNNLSKVGHIMIIEGEDKHIVFCVTGNDSSGFVKIRDTTDTKKKNKDEVKILCKEPVNLHVSCDHMKWFCDVSSVNRRVTLKLKNETPILVEFKIGQDSFLRFYLAPKMNPVFNDDDDDFEDEDDE